ncbi:hypothetical protein EE612_000302 [Oryza sativa]|nr:hypothetical protein EE612_000302 [Oryza sativa]
MAGDRTTSPAPLMKQVEGPPIGSGQAPSRSLLPPPSLAALQWQRMVQWCGGSTSLSTIGSPSSDGLRCCAT